MDRYEIVFAEQDGCSVVELRDSQLGDRARLVPELGGNLISLNLNGREILAAPDSVAQLKEGQTMYGTPILFPPNRVQDGRFTFKGRTYQLPINEEPDRHLHGELSRREWKVVERGSSDDKGAYIVLSFRYADHEDMLTYFPHPLSFRMTFSLREGQLHMGGTIHNEGKDEAAFAFGLHPYFYTPRLEQGDGVLQAPAAREWPITRFTFVTGPPEDTALAAQLRQGMPLHQITPLGSAMLELQQLPERVCRLQLKEQGYTIAYQFGETFPYLLIFRPNWSESICLEPYSCLTDAFNLPYPADMTGARGIGPGEQLAFETSMWVEDI
ncbi:hypothetical protein E6C60_2940 [Paenibacillus algicola]|uniref:Aldose 1-epimerase n=1 Tax=Paenibacillus algicola TaxID=2565926 RepID=A0A4P8XPQ6_9BACL|nr:aldose 1-epimerase [Paenibacillus algicola]QCT03651.1 hypothetical protein E6C60_2940 [Paenibacillus algicola]